MRGRGRGLFKVAYQHVSKGTMKNLRADFVTRVYSNTKQDC
jgi:hypothetical protein